MVTKKLKVILMITLKIILEIICIYIYICQVTEEPVKDIADYLADDPEENHGLDETIPAHEPCADNPDDATRRILKENKHAHKRNQDVSGYRRQVLVVLVVLVMLIQENYNHWLAVTSLLRLVILLRYGML